MGFISSILPFLQATFSIILVIAIILQRTSVGVGGAFGGGDGTVMNHTRRGAEKILFQTTIVIAILFALSAFLALFA